MSKLSEEFSTIVGRFTEPGKYKQTIANMEYLGGFSRKIQEQVLVLLFERLEKVEEQLYGQPKPKEDNTPLQPTE